MAKRQPQPQLKLGEGAAFVKTRLKRLPQEDETWEADFRALPKPLTQTATHYYGLVVSQPDGFLLADEQIEGRPSINDLATLLAHAMRRPLTGNARRPSRFLLRGHRKWHELFPHLEELGIEVEVRQDLRQVEDAYKDNLRQMRERRRKEMVKPTDDQLAVETRFPAIAKWVRDYGHIEIGDQEMFGFVVRAWDYGGIVFEDDKAETLAEAMAALENALGEHLEREGNE